MLEISRTDVNSADARALLAELDTALERLTGLRPFACGSP